MEIERKFLADPGELDLTQYKKKEMSQGYISTDPVIRIRQSNDSYILTVKNGGLLVREEFETPLSREQYNALAKKAEGVFLSKTRYLIPLEEGYTAELDIFHEALEGLVYVEVEFPTVEEAQCFRAPKWFLREVTEDGSYTNAALSRLSPEELVHFLEKAKDKGEAV